ncbi:MAG: hypothetical protein DHS80DRAFT_33580 [Piptocephalis tieghemiana]|nr:MAG: hypothetical protein DHS80DRAFT_33580 [Piptocephalis tieghemiana]
MQISKLIEKLYGILWKIVNSGPVLQVILTTLYMAKVAENGTVSATSFKLTVQSSISPFGLAIDSGDTCGTACPGDIRHVSKELQRILLQVCPPIPISSCLLTSNLWEAGCLAFFFPPTASHTDEALRSGCLDHIHDVFLGSLGLPDRLLYLVCYQISKHILILLLDDPPTSSKVQTYRGPLLLPSSSAPSSPSLKGTYLQYFPLMMEGMMPLIDMQLVAASSCTLLLSLLPLTPIILT